MDENNQLSIESQTMDDSNKILEQTISTTFEISGFWRRLLAFCIDGLILSMPLMLLGFVFQDIAFSLGPLGRLIGFGIAFVYFSYFNSELGRGQTIGKRVTKIMVVDRYSNFLPITTTIVRALVLILIPLLNRWPLPIFENPLAAILATTIIFGGNLAMFYGLVFNRKTRQGIHDLLIGSFVIRNPAEHEVTAPDIPLIHKIFTYVLVSFGLIIGLTGFLLESQVGQNIGFIEPGEWEEIQELHSSLSLDDRFISVYVGRQNHIQLGNSSEWKELKIEVWIKTSCRQKPEYCDDIEEEIAISVFETHDQLDLVDGLRITLINQFDLGLARGYFNQSRSLSIEEWQAQLDLE